MNNNALIYLYCIVMLLIYLSCPILVHSCGNNNDVLYCIYISVNVSELPCKGRNEIGRKSYTSVSFFSYKKKF